MNALLVLYGEKPSRLLLLQEAEKADVIVAADGAATMLLENGIVPHLAVGDFDSLSKQSRYELKSSGCRIIKLPVKKDETDGAIAMRIAIETGADSVVLLGACGKRADHFLGNILLLRGAAQRGVTAAIKTETETLCVLCEGKKGAVSGKKGDTISFIPLTDGTAISSTHLLFPVRDVILPTNHGLGVSNVLTRAVTRIVCHSGCVLICHISSAV